MPCLLLVRPCGGVDDHDGHYFPRIAVVPLLLGIQSNVPMVVALLGHCVAAVWCCWGSQRQLQLMDNDHDNGISKVREGGREGGRETSRGWCTLQEGWYEWTAVL